MVMFVYEYMFYVYVCVFASPSERNTLLVALSVNSSKHWIYS